MMTVDRDQYQKITKIDFSYYTRVILRNMPSKVLAEHRTLSQAYLQTIETLSFEYFFHTAPFTG